MDKLQFLVVITEYELAVYTTSVHSVQAAYQNITVYWAQKLTRSNSRMRGNVFFHSVSRLNLVAASNQHDIHTIFITETLYTVSQKKQV